MIDKEMIAVFHYDDGSHRCGAEPYRYAEEVVRCKECDRWFGDAYIFDTDDDCDTEYRRCRGFGGMYTSADGFCYQGERRE